VDILCNLTVRPFCIRLNRLTFGIATGRLDALVFSGGLGENSPELRSAVIQRCTCLGFDHVSEVMNTELSHGKDVVYDIGQGIRQTRILVCKTNEEVCLIPVIGIIINRQHISWRSHGSVCSRMNIGGPEGQTTVLTYSITSSMCMRSGEPQLYRNSSANRREDQVIVLEALALMVH
jgi:Acetokinase family